MGLNKYRVSVYALSMFIRYPNYTHRIPNESPEILFRRMFELVYRGFIFEGLLSVGAYIRDFTA